MLVKEYFIEVMKLCKVFLQYNLDLRAAFKQSKTCSNSGPSYYNYVLTLQRTISRHYMHTIINELKFQSETSASSEKCDTSCYNNKYNQLRTLMLADVSLLCQRKTSFILL